MSAAMETDATGLILDHLTGEAITVAEFRRRVAHFRIGDGENAYLRMQEVVEEFLTNPAGNTVTLDGSGA